MRMRAILSLLEASEVLDPDVTNLETLHTINPAYAARHDALKRHHHGREVPDDVSRSVGRYSEISGRLSRHLIATKGNLTGARGEEERARVQQVKHMDAYLKAAKPLEEPLTVYSSLGFMPEGDVLTTHAYLSTSIDPDRAAAHANDRRRANRADFDVIAVFDLPEGFTGGRYLGSFANYQGEMEFLLARGQSFAITGRSSHRLSAAEGPFTRHILRVQPN